MTEKMRLKNKWFYVHTFDEYYDFERELQSFCDEGNTSIDVRLTFNTETRTAYFTVATHNDDGNTHDWGHTHYLPWDKAMATLLRDGCDNIPEELK